MDQLKTSPDPYINFALLSTIGYLPAVIAKKAAAVFSDKASGVLTNVPGPRQSLYFAGQRIENFMFWVPRSGKIGLGISIFSYDGKVTVGVASDEKLMPDPEVLLEGFEDEFNTLLEMVQSGKIYDEPLVLHDRYKEGQAAAKAQETGKDNEKKTRAKCRAVTRKGKPCRNKSLTGSAYCGVHRQLKDKDSQLQDVARIIRELAGA